MIHSTAIVETVDVGEGTKIWAWSHVRECAKIGKNCIIGEHAYIDHDVVIGDGCKIQNGANLYAPLSIHKYVFIGPGVIVCNDRHPRAWNWDSSRPPLTVIHDRASIGAGSILMPGVQIGESAMVGSGSVVTEDVAPNTTVVGNPARVVA